MDENGAKKDYWQIAVDKLQKEDSSVADQIAGVQQAAAAAGNADFAAQLLHTTRQGQQALEAKRWKIITGSQEWVLRDQFDRLVKAVTLFKDVGNAARSIDPLHAGLPLAGFCVLMQMATNDSKQYAAMVAGVEEIVTIVARYQQIEALYLLRPVTVLKQEFERHLLSLYKHIILYQISATCYYRRNTMLRFIRAFPKLDDLSEVMETIRRDDIACRNIGQVFDSSDALERHKELIDKLDRFEKYLMNQKDPDINHRVESTIKPSYIPFPRNRRFVGRGAELEALTQRLLVTKACQRLALVGLGGVGKSQVALEFAYTVKETRPKFSIFWMAALSAESFEQACADIARKLHLVQAAGDQEDVKELVKQSLSAETAGRWLLIVDNADDMDILYGSSLGESISITDYLPDSEDGLIVFTTRYQEAAVALAGGDVIELETMSREEAVKFLKKSLIRKDVLDNDAITTELLEELTYLPLAIAQAAAYLNTNKISIAQYLGLLRNTEQDIISVMSREFRDSTRYKGSQNAVATTWLVSFDQILQYNAIAADLLSFMSCIEPKAIPRSILPVVQPEERMVSAVGMLSGYAFVVQRDDEETYDLHRLVHLATRIWVRKNGLTAEIVVKAIQHVARVFLSDEYENRELWREYLPHALRVLKSDYREDVVERYDLCTKVGRCLQADGRVRESVRWLEEAFRWTNNNFGEEHPSRLASQHALATAYQADGQVGKAVKLLQHVVAVEAKVLRDDHPSRLVSQRALAVLHAELKAD